MLNKKPFFPTSVPILPKGGTKMQLETETFLYLD
jgi:hypothetical protein